MPPTPGTEPAPIAPPPAACLPIPTLPSVMERTSAEPSPVALPDAPPGASPWAPNADNGADAPLPQFEPVGTEQRSRKPLMLAVAALTAVAIGIGGFFVLGNGSGTDDAGVRYVPGDGADSADAFSFSTATTSVDLAPAMQITMEMEAPGMSAEMNARFDRESRRASMSLDATGSDEMLGFDFSDFDVVSDGATATTYMSGASYASFFQVATDWVSFTAEDGGDNFGFDEFFEQPFNMASVFVGLDPVDLGVESVDGEQLKHFSITMTIDQLLAEDPNALEGYGSADLTQLDSITYEVWVTESSLLRRVLLDTEVDGERITFDMKLDHFGEPIDIALPDPADVTDWQTLMADSDWGDIGAIDERETTVIDNTDWNQLDDAEPAETPQDSFVIGNGDTDLFGD